MENGAGLDYSDNPPDPNADPPYEGGDMWGEKYPGVSYDKYHPNDKGNTKMARKFYKELIKVLPEPTNQKNNYYHKNNFEYEKQNYYMVITLVVHMFEYLQPAGRFYCALYIGNKITCI